MSSQITTTISSLPAATLPLQGTEQIPADQLVGGVMTTVRMPASALGGGGGGSVTSVGLALPSIFTVSGSPVTSAGTLTGALATQSPNLVFAGPSSGSAAVPNFRVLVSADFPASGVTAGNYGSSSKIPVLTVDATGRVTAASVVSAPSGFANPMTTQYDIIVGGVSGAAGRFGAPTAAGTYALQFAPGTGYSWTAFPAGGGGTVTSVGLADSTGLFTITGTPVTNAGTLTLSALASQAANTFFAAPNGLAGAPAMRTIVDGDLPASGVTAGTYGDATHTLTATLDSTGRITSISTNPISGGGGGSVFTFTPQAAPTLAAGITWGDSTQNALQTYINGVKGWLPTILAVATAKQVITISGTVTNLFPSTYIGSLTLPANFFVVGKTIEVEIAGYITTSPGSTTNPIPSLVIGGTTIGGASSSGGLISTTAVSFMMTYLVTCLTTGASGTVMSFCRGSTDGNNSLLIQASTLWTDSNKGTTSTLNTTVSNAIMPKLSSSVSFGLTVTSARVTVIA